MYLFRLDHRTLWVMWGRFRRANHTWKNYEKISSILWPRYTKVKVNFLWLFPWPQVSPNLLFVTVYVTTFSNFTFVTIFISVTLNVTVSVTTGFPNLTFRDRFRDHIFRFYVLWPLSWPFPWPGPHLFTCTENLRGWWVYNLWRSLLQVLWESELQTFASKDEVYNQSPC